MGNREFNRKTPLLNYKVIASLMGVLLILNGIFMLISLLISWYYKTEHWDALLISGLIAVSCGSLAFYLGKGHELRKQDKSSKKEELKKKDGFMIVTLGWVLMSFFGCLPYVISGEIPSLTDAFFETISGYSTTGASILTDIEAVDKGILFWRSLTQWIGGMGIIVLTVAILPILGIGGMQLFVAEAPGISPDKLQPRIKETAKRLWWVYLGLTMVEMVLLMFGGMDLYDALNHALTTMATGGFSTKNTSAADMSPYIQYVMIVFMFLAGMNFTLNYFLFKRKFREIWENEEFKAYLALVIFSTVIVAGVVYSTSFNSNEKIFRDSLFQIVSIITTTGYVSANYMEWPSLAIMWVFILMFIGAMAGSTAGGVKLVRHILLFKNTTLELKRQLHPSAIIPVRFNNNAVTENIIYNVLAFIVAYIFVFGIGVLILSGLGLDFNTSLGAVATSLGNIGPGIGSVGPVDNFAHLPAASKWILSFLMLLGRLELFTVLIIFTPSFWRKY
ncbi:TrkH family potassium uptake protein [Sediminitomix flava]|uniref:Trk system potassium uptake protein TrkH n=1 Tax=Sediminitomix flava TaxID=379075 RepID=A0A315ZB37_SEDFL|nr:TrkH family potassium uptake protein [Sediminitomix flava]PWJ42570.1 trk system potassium uptake protein TrkH [Sediminitomix flava]